MTELHNPITRTELISAQLLLITEMYIASADNENAEITYKTLAFNVYVVSFM